MGSSIATGMERHFLHGLTQVRLTVLTNKAQTEIIMLAMFVAHVVVVSTQILPRMVPLLGKLWCDFVLVDDLLCTQSPVYLRACLTSGKCSSVWCSCGG